MLEPEIPKNEEERLKALCHLEILDTEEEERFDRITRLAQKTFNVPIALVSLVDANRQWFKSKQGLQAVETPRNISFCGHAILSNEILHISDTLNDHRFADNPLVVGAPYIRMYAGAPIKVDQGQRIGTLCLISDEPRELSKQELMNLRDFADCVEQELNMIELRDANRTIVEKESHLQALLNTVSDGILVVDEFSQIHRVNPAIEKIFGYAKDNLIGKSFESIIKEGLFRQKNEVSGKYFSVSIEEVLGLSRELTGINEAGDEFPVEITLAEMESKEFRFFVGIVRDLSEIKRTQRMLLETKDRLVRTIEGSNDGLWDWNIRTNAVWFSKHFKEMLGFKESEFEDTFESFADRLHPDDYERTMAEINRHLNHEGPYDIEYRLKCKSGNYKWIRARAQAVWNEKDDPIVMSGTIMDISWQKENERVIHKYITALESLHLITGNSELSFEEKMSQLLELGLNVFELSIAIVSHVEQERYCVEYVEGPKSAPDKGDEFELGCTYCVHTLEAGKPTGFYHAGESEIKEHPCYLSFKLESYLGAPVYVNNELFGTLNFSSSESKNEPFSEGDFSLIQLFAHWIGHELGRERIRKELKNALLFTECILNSTDLSIISTDLDGVITTFNHGAEAMLGYEASELVDKETPAIIHDVDEVVARAAQLSQELNKEIQPGFEVFVAKAKTGIVDESEWTYVCKDQSKLPVSLSVSVLNNYQKQPIGYLGIATDITQRKKAKQALIQAKIQAEEHNRLKSEFINLMSHELRTPLTVILGYIPILMAKTQPLDLSLVTEIASEMKVSGDHLLQLINDMLDLSKIEAGKMTFRIEDFDVSELISIVMDNFQQSASDKHIELINASNKMNVKADPNRVKQILFNLIGNALKFTDKGQIKVTTESLSDSVLIKVIDTGVGIPKGDLPHIFERFKQVDSTSTRTAGGTGLGLAICQRLVELQEGELTVVSQLNEGSEFCFTLPKG